MSTKVYFMWKCLTASTGEQAQKPEFYMEENNVPVGR